MATLDQALEQVAIGGSISQTFWTQHPESAGIESEEGKEYQVKVVLTKTGSNSHRMEAQILATRQKEE
jgi:hypothetical protein